MKILGLSLLRRSPLLLLSAEYELSSINYFQRSSVQEFMVFFAKVVAERTEPGVRQSVEENSYLVHVYCRRDGLCGVLFADAEYPSRVAFTLLSKIMDEYDAQFGAEWKNAAATASFPPLRQYLTKYQDPQQADPIMKVQKELDETKVILHKTIDSMLERGQKLDDLVEASEDLNFQSKAFFKSAAATNSCCVIS